MKNIIKKILGLLGIVSLIVLYVSSWYISKDFNDTHKVKYTLVNEHVLEKKGGYKDRYVVTQFHFVLKRHSDGEIIGKDVSPAQAEKWEKGDTLVYTEKLYTVNHKKGLFRFIFWIMTFSLIVVSVGSFLAWLYDWDW